MYSNPFKKFLDTVYQQDYSQLWITRFSESVRKYKCVKNYARFFSQVFNNEAGIF